MTLCVLKAALNIYHPDDSLDLTKFLSEQTRDELAKLDVSLSPKQLIESAQTLAHDIHYSWLAVTLGREEHATQSLYLGSLPGPLAQTLSTLLKAPISPLSKPLKQFFQNAFNQRIKPSAIPSKCCLPPSPLNALLEMRKRHLVRLIGFLGLRDVGAALRKVIDPARINKIRDLLTDAQKHYLDRCMREHDPIPTDLNLTGWDGDQIKLSRLLQMQGLKRLAIGMHNEEKALVWYLSRHLDKGRGELLNNYVKEPIDPKMSLRYREQIVELIDL